MASYTLHIQYVDRPAETRTFTQAKVTFGRDSGDVVLHDTQVSGRHGEIIFENGTLRYTDVGSTNGSFLLQGQRVANIELTPGIALRLGNSLITVQVIDAPNVAGKGRTMIAGPGMAPGFPAPMRAAPPGGGATPVPRAGGPIPAPVPGPPPGAFAFAPTAQMQGPVPPGGMPGRPAPMAPAPMAPAPGRPAPMAPAPMMPASQPSPVSQAPQAIPAPQPMPVPQPPGPPPGPPPGTMAGSPTAPMSAPASMMPATPSTMANDGAMPEGGVAAAPEDVVGAIKHALLRGLEVFTPVAAGATLLVAAVFVPLALLGQIFLQFLPLGVAGVLTLLLALAQLAALTIVLPSLHRYILGAYLGEPVDLVANVKVQVANAKDVVVNCFVPSLVLGVFAGPIYFVEGKKLGEVISRNFNLLGRHLVPILGAVFGFAIVATLVNYLVAWILGMLPVGWLLASLWINTMTAIMVAYFASFSVAMYFDLRRRFEGGDPEGEARARLAAALPPGA